MQRTKVLLVEDSPIAARVGRLALESHGAQVDVAVDGQSALDYAEQGQYDLIFMDIGLPDMSGIDVTTEIRAREREQGLEAVPIVALTANPSCKGNCLDAGMDGFAEKPLTGDLAERMLGRFCCAK